MKKMGHKILMLVFVFLGLSLFGEEHKSVTTLSLNEESQSVMATLRERLGISNGFWVPDFHVDVLLSKNVETYREHLENVERFAYNLAEVFPEDYIDEGPGYVDMEPWYDAISTANIYITPGEDEKIFDTITLSYTDVATVIDAEFIEGGMHITAHYVEEEPNKVFAVSWLPIEWPSFYENKDNFSLYFIFDGDYLNLYFNDLNPENLLAVFVNLNAASYDEYNSFRYFKSYNSDNITLPRYADGTSSFDNKTIIMQNKESQVIADTVRITETEGVNEKELSVLPSEEHSEKKRKFVLSDDFAKDFVVYFFLLLPVIGLIAGCLQWRFLLLLAVSILISGVHILILILGKAFFANDFMVSYILGLVFMNISYALGRLVRKIIVVVKTKKNSTT